MDLTQEKLHVIYNSLSYTKQLKIRRKIKRMFYISKSFRKNTYPTLIFIGRLTNEKKLGLLLNQCNWLIMRDLILMLY